MLRKILGAVLALTLAAAAVALWFEVNGLTIVKDIDLKSVRPEQGAAFFTPIEPDTYIVLRPDDMQDAQGSSMSVLENGQPLGPPHTPHDAIRQNGRGAFSHWGDGLRFSTSDNSDPRTNGRTYRFSYVGPLIPGSPFESAARYVALIAGSVAGLALIWLIASLPKRASDGAQASHQHALDVDMQEEARSPVGTLRRAASFLVRTVALTAAYAAIFLVLYASIKAQQSTTGTFKINYEYRVF